MMRLVTDEIENDATAADEWPAEVDMILSAMDAATAQPAADRPAVDRRSVARHAHRVRGDLRLYAHDPDQPPIAIFTRDISDRGVGFITKDRLPLGYNGLVRLTLDGGDVLTAACNVYRCREAIGGWYEGALHFTNRQNKLR